MAAPEVRPDTMAVIALPPVARKLSPFMFSAALVGALAAAGLEGVQPTAAGAEMFPADRAGPLVLG